MRKKWEKRMTLLLSTLLCISLLPISAFAEGSISAADSGTIAMAEEEVSGQGTIEASVEEKQETGSTVKERNIGRGMNTSGRKRSLLTDGSETAETTRKGMQSSQNSKSASYFFSTFSELESIVNSTYDEVAYADYTGSSDFTVIKNITLPKNLEVRIYTYSCIIPEDIRITVESGAVLAAENLVVNGTVDNKGKLKGELIWENGEIAVRDKLSVNETGTIDNSGTVEYPYEIIGLDRISGYGPVYIGFPIRNDADLATMLDMAGTDTSHYYDGYPITGFSFEEGHVFAPNCSLFVYGVEVTIARTAKFSLNESSILSVDQGGTLILEGILINNGTIEVYDAFGDFGRSTFICSDIGQYSGKGVLVVEASSEDEIFSSFLAGMDDYYFDIHHYANYGFWVLILKTDALRIYGSDRYETCLLIADQLKEKVGTFPAVVVASGEGFPDALAGSYLANKVGAPILLIRDDKADMVCSYIRENMVSGGTIYILGGTGVVSAAAENKLKAVSDNVTRLWGSTRFETNLEILKAAGVSAGDEIVVCIGNNFADSLSVSSTGKAILLVNKNALTAEQKEYLTGLKGSRFTILGGPAVIYEAVANELSTFGTVERIYGSTRYETSTLIAERYFGNAKQMVIAVGTNYPDGLSAGPLANAMGAPLVLTSNGNTAAAAAYTEPLALKEGVAIGGPVLLNDATVREIFKLNSADKIDVITN